MKGEIPLELREKYHTDLYINIEDKRNSKYEIK